MHAANSRSSVDERVQVDEGNIGSLNSGAESPDDTPASLSAASAHPGMGTGGIGSPVRVPGPGSRRMVRQAGSGVSWL
jgi:hypothetical protein